MSKTYQGEKYCFYRITDCSTKWSRNWRCGFLNYGICSLLVVYWCFRGENCLDLQDWQISPKPCRLDPYLPNMKWSRPRGLNFNFQSYEKLNFMLLLIYMYQINQLYQFHRFQCASVACLQLFAVLSWFFRVTCLDSRVRRKLRCQQMPGSCLLFSDILRNNILV